MPDTFSAPHAGHAADPLALLRTHLPDIAAAAALEDHDGAFPAGAIVSLHETGLLAAPLRLALGGLGWGSEPAGAAPLAVALRLIGRASLPLGRLYEGHVNALRLVQRHGTPSQARAAAQEARAGLLFAVWNTEVPGEPLSIDRDGRVMGRKILCSGAGQVARALVTARDAATPEAPPRMLLVPLAQGERTDLSGWTAQGMRASATGAVDLTGIEVGSGMQVGRPGDYGLQPDFSAGAWRFAAVHCGGLEAVLGAMRDHLRRTGRGADPHQAARLGQAAIASGSARLWIEAAALRAEAPDAGMEAVAFVNLARLAVERAALDVMELAQRSVGLNAFLRPNPLERICRDLATYLRQPAPDRALTEAAAHLLAAEAEPGEVWDIPVARA
ncbi:acyl-CoA dehydrogenase family protein [Belnapia sp. T18]|uniref:Acyl-CoA dehydrogenase family protein n=1 Tax=Belnapia arida TaxID=2804533 RepID=A0ABS1U5Z3_9PROT|nr:acyl-CoA dehydrogenase family protein [Belnapia arida]MBL6080073.1 acyl-CoA dehydrogenase family protein [Belnapia arida]